MQRATVIALVVVAVASLAGGAEERPSKVLQTAAPRTTIREVIRPSTTVTEASEKTTTTTTAAPAGPTLPADTNPSVFTVASVTDGDTLVLADGRRIRLAQVDAPETSECFGANSAAHLKAFAAGASVYLRRPAAAPPQDRYGRTVAEVLAVSGDALVSLNEMMIRDGFAEFYEQFAGEDADLAGRLAYVENQARTAKVGLWTACAAPAPPPSSPTTARPPAGAPSSSCHPSYTGTCIPQNVSDADCAGGKGDGPHYVQERDIGVVGPDEYGLDHDNDGVGCES